MKLKFHFLSQHLLLFREIKIPLFYPQQAQVTRLSEDNERISEQLATCVERPRAEGREANGSSTPEPNGKSHNEEDNEWHKKYLAISQEHEQM